jgi:hypothetical protein
MDNRIDDDAKGLPLCGINRWIAIISHFTDESSRMISLRAGSGVRNPAL